MSKENKHLCKTIWYDLKETDKQKEYWIEQVNNILVTSPKAHANVINELFNSASYMVLRHGTLALILFYKSRNRSIMQLCSLPGLCMEHM